MAVDIPKLFNEQLPEALTKNADEAKTINATYQMNITGAGSWHLDLTSAGPKVTQGEKPADCTITITSEDFQKLQENPAAGMQLFFAGKLKIAGNQMLGMKLQKLFSFK
jgi:putative sterol carrier protein